MWSNRVKAVREAPPRTAAPHKGRFSLGYLRIRYQPEDPIPPLSKSSSAPFSIRPDPMQRISSALPLLLAPATRTSPHVPFHRVQQVLHAMGALPGSESRSMHFSERSAA